MKIVFEGHPKNRARKIKLVGIYRSLEPEEPNGLSFKVLDLYTKTPSSSGRGHNAGYRKVLHGSSLCTNSNPVRPSNELLARNAGYIRLLTRPPETEDPDLRPRSPSAALTTTTVFAPLREPDSNSQVLKSHTTPETSPQPASTTPPVHQSPQSCLLPGRRRDRNPQSYPADAPQR